MKYLLLVRSERQELSFNGKHFFLGNSVNEKLYLLNENVKNILPN